MRVLKRVDPALANTPVVGYVNRRTGKVVCPKHGEHDIESPRSPWAAVRVVDRPHARYEAAVPVICQECGAWLNNESTCYANVSAQDDYWKRWLRVGHRDG